MRSWEYFRKMFIRKIVKGNDVRSLPFFGFTAPLPSGDGSTFNSDSFTNSKN